MLGGKCYIGSFLPIRFVVTIDIEHKMERSIGNIEASGGTFYKIFGLLRPPNPTMLSGHLSIFVEGKELRTPLPYFAAICEYFPNS